jgi:hypothetical protein
MAAAAAAASAFAAAAADDDDDDDDDGMIATVAPVWQPDADAPACPGCER